jgi:hypothetical protein
MERERDARGRESRQDAGARDRSRAAIKRPVGFDVVDSGIDFLDRVGAEMRLQFLELASRKVVTIVKNVGSADLGLDASPDDRTILSSRVDTSINDLMLVESFRKGAACSSLKPPRPRRRS